MSVINSFVKIFEHHVEKYTDRPVETARKYSAIQEVGARFGFTAPRVLSIMEDRIVLERLLDIVSLRDLYINGEKRVLNAAILRAGEALGALHKDLPRAPRAPWLPPAGFMSDLKSYAQRSIEPERLPHALLHGDYGFSNVFVMRGSNDTIAIIDPCPNLGSTLDLWELGPVYVDVGKMLACLEGQIPAHRQMRRPTSSRINELQSLFVSGYERLGFTLDMEVANAFAYAVASAQFRRRFGKLGVLRQTVLYNKFRRNYPFTRKLDCMRYRDHE